MVHPGARLQAFGITVSLILGCQAACATSGDGLYEGLEWVCSCDCRLLFVIDENTAAEQQHQQAHVDFRLFTLLFLSVHSLNDFPRCSYLCVPLEYSEPNLAGVSFSSLSVVPRGLVAHRRV